MILKEKGRKACLTITFQLYMFCGWDVLYLLHQPASSWEASQKPQKTSTKEAVFQQFKPRTPWMWCVTTKHHTTSQKSGGENSLHRVVWRVEHATCRQSVCCVCLSVLTAITLATLHLSHLVRSHQGKWNEDTVLSYSFITTDMPCN
jgi:hypothetical protein